MTLLFPARTSVLRSVLRTKLIAGKSSFPDKTVSNMDIVATFEPQISICNTINLMASMHELSGSDHSFLKTFLSMVEENIDQSPMYSESLNVGT